MKISKTLFKDFARCKNFLSYYDIYINRFLHEVREIDNIPLKNNEELMNDIESLPADMFSEEFDMKKEIYDFMFDDETGEDLTVMTNAQMEAFKDIFTEVERLAAIYVSNLYKKEVIASTNTFEQKKYSYNYNGHTFYCYLDIYFEDDDSINIFEVKSTTSKKFDELVLKFRSKDIPEEPLFLKYNDGVCRYIGRDLVGLQRGKKVVTLEDVLKKEEKLYDRFSKEGKYIYDLAVERHIVENSIKQNQPDFSKKINYHLVVLNSEYHFDGKYDSDGKPIYGLDEEGNALFKIYELNDITLNLQDDIINQREQIMSHMDYMTINTNSLSKSCEYKKTTQCKFCNICMKKVLKDGSILEYLAKNHAFKEVDENGKDVAVDLYDMINRGYYNISDCYEFLRKPDNIVQYNCYTKNETYQDINRIKYAIQNISYPIYHLDFESYNCPLPRFRGEKPYDQSLFQYSLHIERAPGVCDIDADHKEFLAKDHTDQREALTKQLVEDIDLSNGGCVMAYNIAFEKTRIKELAGFFPKYAKELKNINNHLFDLLYVLKGNKDLFENYNKILGDKALENPNFTYYHNNLHGSFSIKKVLPIFTNLSYKNLVVKNGTEAIVTYGMLPLLTEQEYKDKYLALRVYCRQDTWAMVEILRGLRKM